MIAVKVNAGRKLLTEPWTGCHDLMSFLIGQNAYNNVLDRLRFATCTYPARIQNWIKLFSRLRLGFHSMADLAQLFRQSLGGLCNTREPYGSLRRLRGFR